MTNTKAQVQQSKADAIDCVVPTKGQHVSAGRMVRALLSFFGTFAVLGLLAIPAIIVGGAGHGSACGAVFVLPWGVVGSSGVAAVVAVAIYGLALAVGALCDRWGTVFKWLIVVHGCGVILALIKSVN